MSVLRIDGAGEEREARLQFTGAAHLMVRQTDWVVVGEVEPRLVGVDPDDEFSPGMPRPSGLRLVAAGRWIVTEDDEVLPVVGQLLDRHRPTGRVDEGVGGQAGPSRFDGTGGPITDLQEAHQTAGFAPP